MSNVLFGLFGGGGAAVAQGSGSVYGQLVASTRAALNTGVVSDGTRLVAGAPTAAGRFQFDAGAGAPASWSIDGQASISWPRFDESDGSAAVSGWPETASGLWIQAVVSDDVADEVFLPRGEGVAVFGTATGNLDFENLDFSRSGAGGQTAQRIKVAVEEVSVAGHLRDAVRFYGAGTGLPVAAKISVYFAVGGGATGPTGPQGRRGPEGPVGPAATISTDATLSGDGSSGDALGIADAGVDTTKLAAEAVTAAKIENRTITSAQMADGGIDRDDVFSSGIIGRDKVDADFRAGLFPAAPATLPTMRQINLIERALGTGAGGNGFLRAGAGIDIEFDTGSNFVTISATGGAVAPTTHTRYAAIGSSSTDSNFAAADFTDATRGASSQTDALTLPTWAGTSPGAGDRYIAFAVPDDTGDITNIWQGRSDNSWFGQFQRVAGTIQISGAAYKVWRSRTALYQLNSGEIVNLVQGG